MALTKSATSLENINAERWQSNYLSAEMFPGSSSALHPSIFLTHFIPDPYTGHQCKHTVLSPILGQFKVSSLAKQACF